MVTTLQGDSLNNVVHLGNLGSVRDMLIQWEAVRQEILTGEVSGFTTVLRSSANKETFHMGGVYKASQREALKAVLKLSVARMKAEDPPLKLCGS